MKLIATLYMIICSFAIFCSVDSANLKENSEQSYGKSYGRQYGHNYDSGRYGRYGRYGNNFGRYGRDYGYSQKNYYGHN